MLRFHQSRSFTNLLRTSPICAPFWPQYKNAELLARDEQTLQDILA